MPLSQSEIKLDRAVGCLVGLAVGDAIGTTLEFSPRDSYSHITDMVGGGPFNLKAGQWTDDTSMALCLADSFLEKKQLDPSDLIERFVRWSENGENSCTGRCFDIGWTISNALDNFKATGNPFAGSEDPMSAGNGSLMRLAPVPIFYKNDLKQARLAARLQSETTHKAQECLDACEYFALLLFEAINGHNLEHVLQSRQLNLSSSISNIAKGSFKEKSRDEIKSSGYVVHTLEAALWSVYNSDSYEESVLCAANLGCDADTVAAVTGQLAGANWGVSGIPEHWLEKLAWRSHLEELATHLYSTN